MNLTEIIQRIRMPKPKKEIMAEGRAARKARGLTESIMVHIRPDQKERLIRYVTRTLKGECPTRGK